MSELQTKALHAITAYADLLEAKVIHGVDIPSSMLADRKVAYLHARYEYNSYHGTLLDGEAS